MKLMMTGICKAGSRDWVINTAPRPMKSDEFAAKHPKELEQMIAAGLTYNAPLEKMSFIVKNES